MTVRVDLVEDGRFIEVAAAGHVTRREAGWATERARELSQQPSVVGILADCRDSDIADTPVLAREYVENFLLAIERPMVVAYVKPLQSDRAFLGLVARQVRQSKAIGQIFDDRPAALAWLATHHLDPA